MPKTRPAKVGHNSENADAGALLRNVVERIERLNEEKRTLTADISEVYAEAKSGGLNPKILRRLIAQRQRDAEQEAEAQALLDIYTHAMDGPDDADN